MDFSKFKMELKKYLITYSLIAIIVLVYLYTTIKYSSSMTAYEGYLAGSFSPIMIRYSKEYYRFFTANFIHFGFIHLFCNAISLYNLGRFIEQSYQRINYLILIFVSAISTTLLPYLYTLIVPSTTSNYVAGGISGVVFGFIGGLFALAFIYRDVYLKVIKQLSISIIFMIYISITVSNISFSGHLAGFVGGFVVTMLLIKFHPSSRWKNNSTNIIYYN